MGSAIPHLVMLEKDTPLFSPVLNGTKIAVAAKTEDPTNMDV